MATLQSTSFNFNGTQIRNLTNGGAYVLEDNGEWRQIFDKRVRGVTNIHADSRHENVIYVLGGNTMYVSNKGKNTTTEDWVPIPGFKFEAGFSIDSLFNCNIYEDPQNPARVYVTTPGGGTWSLPIAESLVRGGVTGTGTQRE
jgi:hypothetical protein